MTIYIYIYGIYIYLYNIKTIYKYMSKAIYHAYASMVLWIY